MSLCPNHSGARVLATVDHKEKRLCQPCAAKQRVLDLGIAALPLRELGARQLIEQVRP